jgi:hypothetical protein
MAASLCMCAVMCPPAPTHGSSNALVLRWCSGSLCRHIVRLTVVPTCCLEGCCRDEHGGTTLLSHQSTPLTTGAHRPSCSSHINKQYEFTPMHGVLACHHTHAPPSNATFPADVPRGGTRSQRVRACATLSHTGQLPTLLLLLLLHVSRAQLCGCPASDLVRTDHVNGISRQSRVPRTCPPSIR